MRPQIIACCIALLLGLSGCSARSVDQEDDLTGQIRKIQVDCGGWGLQTDDEFYELVSVPDEHKKDGIRVQVEVRHRDDLYSCTMVGPLLEVVHVERLD